MKIENTNQLHQFLDVVDKCEKPVWLVSPNGENYNLKDEMDRYRGIAHLLDDKDEQLELFSDSSRDECRLVDFLFRRAS